MNNTITFQDESYQVIAMRYNNDIVALQLVETYYDEKGEWLDTIATATVNLVEYEAELLSAMDVTGNSYTFIKDYSENEGMLDALVEAGIVSKPLGYYQTGFVTCPLVEVLIGDITKFNRGEHANA
jgi:hypothetical protein